MLYLPKVSIATYIIGHVAVEFNKADNGCGESVPFNFVIKVNSLIKKTYVIVTFYVNDNLPVNKST